MFLKGFQKLGIDAAFGKWRSKKTRTQQVNSLTYCAQAILAEAERVANNTPQNAKKEIEAPFSQEDLSNYIQQNVSRLQELDYLQAVESLQEILKDLDTHYQDLESLEQRLSVLEEKLSQHP